MDKFDVMEVNRKQREHIAELEAKLEEAKRRVNEICNDTVRMTLSEDMENWVNYFVSGAEGE